MYSLDYCINFQKLSPVKNSALITTTWSIKSLTTFVYIKTPFICLFTCQIKYALCPTCVVHLTKIFILHGFYFILANFIKKSHCDLLILRTFSQHVSAGKISFTVQTLVDHSGFVVRHVSFSTTFYQKMIEVFH